MTGMGDRILGLFLLVVAIVLVVGSLYLMIKPDADAKWPVGKSALELVISIIVLVIYALLLEPLGFIISTTLAVGVLSWRMGAPPLRAFVTGLISAVVVFGLFNYGLSLS